MENITLETELNRVVYAKTTIGKYPEPIAFISDEEQKTKLLNLKLGNIQRPSSKTEYLLLIDSLSKEIEDIKNKNEQIFIENNLAKKAIDDKFLSDIEIAKLNEDNLWEAIRSYRNYLLSKCDWTDTVSAQTRLTSSQIGQWNTYRQYLRDITKLFSSPKDVIFPPIPTN